MYAVRGKLIGRRGQKMQNDFSKGKVWKNIIFQAVPLTIAQFVQLLYNVVDRIYIGHMGEGQSMALTGVGITFPVITLIMAFTVLFGNGGVPLFSMARGAKEIEKAKRIQGNSFFLLLAGAAVLMAVCYFFCEPVLFLFGASRESYFYAKEYLHIYLLGTVFSMLTTGMNGYINAQGFPGIGMLTTVLGAVVNIILDPIFIFVLHLGVRGAALATIISQCISCIWVLRFLWGRQADVRLEIGDIRPDVRTILDIVRLGLANFMVYGTNCAVQVACNTTLQTYGGDLYVGVMTVLNSVREVCSLPVTGITHGAQPVVSFYYGAGEKGKVREAIRFNTLLGSVYTLLTWIVVILIPDFWCRIFTSDEGIIEAGVGAIHIYFFGFIFMALQFSGQSVFQALGDAKHAIFFSLLRKVIIVVPLTFLLPQMGFGVNGVFLAEPISNVIGGSICFAVMWRSIYQKRLQ